MKEMKGKTGLWLLAATLCLLSVNLKAQTANETRQLMKLHKEAFFDIRIMESDQASRVAEEVAEFMKKYEDVAITVIGYADRETGNPTLNIYYARGRAENFRRDLVKRFGVDPNRISVDWKGDRVQPFTENARNRCVIIDGYGYEANNLLMPVRNATTRANAQRQ
jgi:outer membrane protein OmpA-like peptidoglycan-associated protein